MEIQMIAPDARVIATFCDHHQDRMKLSDQEMINALELALHWLHERRAANVKGGVDAA